MNVLIFVMTMLMLLSLLTYARLETYRNSQIFQVIFNRYMEQEERGYINLAADKQYMKTKGLAKKKDGAEKKKSELPVAATPRISLAALVDKKLRDAKPEEWKQTQIMLKNLIYTLYGDQTFFRQAIDNQPSLLDDLINALTNTIDDLPKEKKIKKASGLATLSLPNKELDTILYKMLHGAPYLDIPPATTEETVIVQSKDTQEEEDQDDPTLEKEADEYRSPEGYYSLLDFVNLSSMPKVRVFLAPREVLMAIFHEPTIVNDIIAQRQQYFNQALDGKPTKELSETFKNQFDQRRAPEIDAKALDFSVTKTNPQNY